MNCGVKSVGFLSGNKSLEWRGSEQITPEDVRAVVLKRLVYRFLVPFSSESDRRRTRPQNKLSTWSACSLASLCNPPPPPSSSSLLHNLKSVFFLRLIWVLCKWRRTSSVIKISKFRLCGLDSCLLNCIKLDAQTSCARVEGKKYVSRLKLEQRIFFSSMSHFCLLALWKTMDVHKWEIHRQFYTCEQTTVEQSWHSFPDTQKRSILFWNFDRIVTWQYYTDMLCLAPWCISP